MLLPHISHLGLTPQGLRTLSTRRQKDGQETILLSYLFLPKAVSDILQLVAIHTAIQALVSGRLVERTHMTDIRSQLDVVEMALVYVARESNAATIPCRLDLRMVVMEPCSQLVDGGRLCVATHKTDAGEHAIVRLDEMLKLGGGQRRAHILPEITAVATRAMAGASRDIDSKGRLIRYFLKETSVFTYLIML